VNGSGIFITHNQKSSLELMGLSDPRKIVIRIMDMLFNQKTLACMSAKGSRSAVNKRDAEKTSGMPDQVKLAIIGI